uniref:Uncharacterized protein n=1 Tax=Chaetoceros debilis TaxID=122233 RepID=A0A6S8Z200_9STRA
MVHAVVRPKPVATTNAQNKIGQSTSTSTSGIKPKMKASDVLAGKKFDALEIKKSSTAETAPESPIGPMETKTTKASEFDNNPFGLKEQAEQWRKKQLQYKGDYLSAVSTSSFRRKSHTFSISEGLCGMNTIAVLNLNQKLISTIPW